MCLKFEISKNTFQEFDELGQGSAACLMAIPATISLSLSLDLGGSETRLSTALDFKAPDS